MFLHRLEEFLAAGVLNQAKNHPLNVGLMKGTLPLSKFEPFIGQDNLCMQDFAEALELTGKRLTDKRQQQIFLEKSREITAYEQNMYDKYLKPQPSHRLFKPSWRKRFANFQIPEVENYTRFVRCNAKYAPVARSAAGLSPCYVLYNKLGIYMLQQMSKNNPYRLWIESYASPNFLASTEAILGVVNELYEGSNFAEREAMVNAAKSSCHYELDFWTAIDALPSKEQVVLPTQMVNAYATI